MKQKNKIITCLIYSISAYFVCLLCFLLSYDSFSIAGCHLYFEGCSFNETAHIFNGRSGKDDVNFIQIKFENGNWVKLYQSYYWTKDSADFVTCEFNRHDLNYSIPAFIEMTDSVTKLLERNGYHGYLSTCYGKKLIPANKKNLTLWYSTRYLLRSLVFKPYLFLIPLLLLIVYNGFAKRL